jgi:ATP-dependent protease HslVU (ClpYQ) ATPase subunit
MTTLLEDLLFDLPEVSEKQVLFDTNAVSERLLRIVEDEDLRKYIL